MSLERHEAAHAVVARVLGWRVNNITINEAGGTTNISSPKGLSVYRRTRDQAVIALAGRMAEQPDLSPRALRASLGTGDDRELTAAIRALFKISHPHLKQRLLMGVFNEARKILTANMPWVDWLEVELGRRATEAEAGDGNPTPDEIARRAAEVRAGWDVRTEQSRRAGVPVTWVPPEPTTGYL